MSSSHFIHSPSSFCLLLTVRLQKEMSDFLILFLLYSCLSSVGCWSIKWRMRLKGGLSLHKQSSRVPGKSSFLTLISLGKYITQAPCGVSRWHMSCLLSELKQIPALGWPGRTAVPALCLCCPVAGRDLSLAGHCSALCPRTCWALLSSAGPWSCCSHREWQGPAWDSHTQPLLWEGKWEIALLPVHEQNHCSFAPPGCLCALGAPLPKKCLQGSGLQAAIS